MPDLSPVELDSQYTVRKDFVGRVAVLGKIQLEGGHSRSAGHDRGLTGGIYVLAELFGQGVQVHHGFQVGEVQDF